MTASIVIYYVAWTHHNESSVSNTYWIRHLHDTCPARVKHIIIMSDLENPKNHVLNMLSLEKL